jgi:hypothetical protein
MYKYIPFLLVVLFTAVHASAKDVTLQITGADALTLSIPEEWEAAVAQVEVHDDDPDGPPEMIIVGPPTHMGPFSAGDDIPPEMPSMALYPQARFYELSEFLVGYRFVRLPLHHDDGKTLLIIEEIHAASGAVVGYYQVKREDDEIYFSADLNMNHKTWSASAKYPVEKHFMTAQFISVVKSIHFGPVIGSSGDDAVQEMLSIVTDDPAPASSTRDAGKNLEKTTCPRCKGEQNAMPNCSRCGNSGHVWVEKPLE